MVAATDERNLPPSEIPRGDLGGFVKYLRADLVSGFLVFLIALPLCLGISIASGYPPVAGVFTAVIGSILTTLLSNSELTIKGPAAGLIVIAVGAVTDFGYTGGQNTLADTQAYRMAFAVGVAAGVIQIVFGVVRAGMLGDFFPTTVVHGMLAAIGVIIMLKQLPVAVGQSAKGDPLEILRELPHTLSQANPQIALIGALSLLILFGLPWLKGKLGNRWLNLIPAQLVVLLVAVPLGIYLDLSHEHTYTFAQHQFPLGEKFLVNVPGNLFSAINSPDFSVLQTAKAWKWVLMFALIGSLESMLSAKAIDLLDPWKRKTNLNRDLIAVGLANTVTACVGGLPMISEIVRSKANVDNGARTRFADMWHGLFLLAFVALAPGMIHRIPLAALAAMLVYTGFRLASPREFINVYKIGVEQLLIFTITVVTVLATDLLIGIGVGIVAKLLVHLLNGVPLRSLFVPYLDVQVRGADTVVISAKESAVFSNWIPFKRQIEQLGLIQRNHIVVDLAGTRYVDHSVMEQLHELEMDFAQANLNFEVIGLESHRQTSAHPRAARKRAMTRLQRVMVVTGRDLERELAKKCYEFGASGYSVTDCRGAGRSSSDFVAPHREQIRLEVIAPAVVTERLLEYIATEVAPREPTTACVDVVEVLRPEKF